MNNHRNNNNNRRGRGRPNNNRNQGGANSANRVDSRARGNAPQLLDKYKKLAQDAQHNDDRVQAEYYLQFADHYFRVIADNKARQDEARAKRADNSDDNSDDQNSGDNRNSNRRPRARRDDQNDGPDNRQNQNGRERGRNNSNDQDDNSDQNTNSDDEQKPVPRETKRPRKPRVAKPVADGGEIDASALPPAIGGSADDAAAKPAVKPKRAPRRRKDSEAAEA